jgi:predicted GNAT family acetyltransferase
MTRASAEVVHNEGAARFEMRMAEGLCIAQYRMVDGVMWLTHTEVPPAIEGRGHAAHLVRTALDHARALGLKVQPACSYVRAYMRRHPESQDLLESHP